MVHYSGYRFWILLHSAGPRHGLPNSGSVTRVTESQPPFLQSYLALVWRYLARVSRSARTAHYLEGTTSGGAVAIRLDLGKRRPGYMPMLDGSSALVIKRPIL